MKPWAFKFCDTPFRGSEWSLTLCLATLVGACGGEAPVGPSTAIEAISRTSLVGTVGETLAELLRVRVTDADGRGVEGVEVIFAAAPGSGELVLRQSLGLALAGPRRHGPSAAAVGSVADTTNDNGEAQARWTLGPQVGEHTVLAHAPGVGDVIFRAEAGPGPPAQFEGDTILRNSARLGDPLTQPFTVRVLDRFGNSVPGAAVSWSVVQGGGAVSDTSTLTDDIGEASTTLTVGPTPGRHLVTAAVQGTTLFTFGGFGVETVVDPTGDGFAIASAGFVAPDLVAFGGLFDPPNQVVVHMRFAQEVHSPLAFDTNSVFGLLDIDIDQNGQTGASAFTDDLRPPRSGSTGLGIEYVVTLDGRVFDVLTGEDKGIAGSLFAGNTLTLRLRLAQLGDDDGNLNMAVIVGTVSEPIDLAPNEGNFAVKSATASAPGRPQRGDVQLKHGQGCAIRGAQWWRCTVRRRR